MGSDTGPHRDGTEGRDWAAAMGRGARHRGPACGEEPFHQRADDAPPSVTTLVVGHLIPGAVVAIDIAYRWPLWLHALVWLPLTEALCLGLPPVVTGALIGPRWALGGCTGSEGEMARPVPALAPTGTRDGA